MAKKKNTQQVSTAAAYGKTPSAAEKKSFMQHLAGMPIYSKITFFTGLIVVVLGVYAMVSGSTTSHNMMAVQQFLLAIMFISMGVREMKHTKGKLNYLLFFITAAFCFYVALVSMGVI